MAEWTTELPGEAVKGNPGHPEDHNKINAALVEIRSNIDGIELTPGPEGPQGPAGMDGAKGAKGDKGADGFGTEAQYTDIISRLEALEAASA